MRHILAALLIVLSTAASATTLESQKATLAREEAAIAAGKYTYQYGTVSEDYKKGDKGIAVDLLKIRLEEVTGVKLPETGEVGIYDDATVQLVRSVQRDSALDDDGKVGEKTRAMLNIRNPERSKRLADAQTILAEVPSTGKFILVNIPNFTLYAYEDGKLVLTSKIISGREQRKTPLLTSNLYAIKFNPDWTVPPGIVKGDIIPKLKKGKYEWFTEHGVVAVAADGRHIDPATITYEDYLANRYKWYQPSGDDNALGVMKFELDNNKNIYLHDTNQRKLFARNSRAYSSGCVRVESYRELASWLTGKPLEAVDAELAKGKTYTMRVPKVTVKIAYSLAMPDGEKVNYFYDVYGAGPKENPVK